MPIVSSSLYLNWLLLVILASFSSNVISQEIRYSADAFKELTTFGSIDPVIISNDQSMRLGSYRRWIYLNTNNDYYERLLPGVHPHWLDDNHFVFFQNIGYEGLADFWKAQINPPQLLEKILPESVYPGTVIITSDNNHFISWLRPPLTVIEATQSKVFIMPFETTNLDKRKPLMVYNGSYSVEMLSLSDQGKITLLLHDWQFSTTENDCRQTIALEYGQEQRNRETIQALNKDTLCQQ